MSTTTPFNPLETAILDAKAQRITTAQMLRALLGADLTVPSGGEVAADGSGFRPILFDKAGTPMIACFTAPERIEGINDLAPYALTTPAHAFLRQVPADHGVVINPGQEIGFEIEADGLQRLLRDAE